MRVLVTGAGGFVGGHLAAALGAAGDEVTTWLGDEESPDITDLGSLTEALDAASDVEVVYHLAAQSRVDLSWAEPGMTATVNTAGTANLLQALAAADSGARVLVMSSAEVYGMRADRPLPLVETAEPTPTSPYGVSKWAAERLALLVGEASGRDIVVARPFNMIGPGQAPNFVTSSFAQRIVANETTDGGQLTVGNLSATRDFLDVRDAVVGLRALAIDGVPGEVYNVCAGQERSIESILDSMVALSPVRHEIVVDPGLLRPNDVPRVVGSADKLVAATGWAPSIGLEETLGDVLEDWRQRPASTQGVVT